MSGPIVFIDTLRIHQGKLADFEQAVREVAELVESSEPQLIAYAVYVDAAGTEATGLQIHPDSESMERHLAVAGPAFGRIMELVDLVRVEIYGEPDDRLLGRLTEMAQAFGGVRLVLKGPRAGFARYGGG